MENQLGRSLMGKSERRSLYMWFLFSQVCLYIAKQPSKHNFFTTSTLHNVLGGGGGGGGKKPHKIVSCLLLE